ncbi:hypothetical protein Patl1_24836 [Pistacia atlantica]|uniref:Uncharacterized protein n=1 Tax=Pistacia atlantica TaxID=434234 RepID=A0ACC1AZX6_9ROSI|nr:hypothetical protein Patl1_24836 [Pistacia atlantica]
MGLLDKVLKDLIAIVTEDSRIWMRLPAQFIIITLSGCLRDASTSVIFLSSPPAAEKMPSVK